MDAAVALSSPEFLEDPYPTYAQLRESDPVHFIEPLDTWILTRMSDVRAAFTDDRFGVVFEQAQVKRLGQRALEQDYFRVGRETLVCLDPPRHTELRRVLRRAFTPTRVKGLHPLISAVCEERLDELVPRGRANLTADYAGLVPLDVISRILGVPKEDQPQIAAWVDDWLPVIEPAPMSEDQLARANAATVGLEGYFHELLAARRAAPGEDFVSEILAVLADEELTIDDDALVANLQFLYFAGQDTQKLMFSNIVAALHANPVELKVLLDEPARTADCIHELYRYDTVGQFMGRMPTEDLEFRGKTIKSGHTVMMCMGAANRDPEAFPDPDRLDLSRHDPSGLALRHITFGAGRHHCLGTHLAQANLPRMLEALLRRMPDMTVDMSAATRYPSIVERGYGDLPASWAA